MKLLAHRRRRFLLAGLFFFLNSSNRIHKTKQPKLQNLSHNLRAWFPSSAPLSAASSTAGPQHSCSSVRCSSVRPTFFCEFAAGATMHNNEMASKQATCQ
jgi:hypothetical protein